MKYTSIVLCIIIICSCASTYVLSDNAKQYLATLDKQTAEKKIEKLSRRSKHVGGLCLAGSLHTGPDAIPVVQDGKLYFAATYEVTTGYSTGSIGGNLTITRHSTVKKGEYAIKLDVLKEIRIVNGNTIPACQYDGSGKIVIVSDKDGIDGMINVTDADLDQLIAALFFLSPNVKIKQGTGL